MGMTNFRLALEKRYAALTGELESVRANIDRIRREIDALPVLEETVVKLEGLIASADNLLRDNNPEWQPEQTPPIQPWTHQIPVPFGTCGRRAMEVLRMASKPMTVREIALEVLRGVGNDAPDDETILRTTNAICASLRSHRGQTVESSGKYPAQWRAINKSSLEWDV